MKCVFDIDDLMLVVLKRVLTKEIENQEELLLKDTILGRSDLFEIRNHIINECVCFIEKLVHNETTE